MQDPSQDRCAPTERSQPVGRLALLGFLSLFWICLPLVAEEGRVLELSAETELTSTETASLEALGGQILPWDNGEDKRSLRVRLSEDRLQAASRLPWVHRARLLPASGEGAIPAMRVYKDPETGRFVSGVPATGADITKAGPSAPLVPVRAPLTLPDGSRRMGLDGRLLFRAIGRLGQDGTPAMSCVPGEGEKASDPGTEGTLAEAANSKTLVNSKTLEEPAS